MWGDKNSPVRSERSTQRVTSCLSSFSCLSRFCFHCPLLLFDLFVLPFPLLRPFSDLSFCLALTIISSVLLPLALSIPWYITLFLPPNLFHCFPLKCFLSFFHSFLHPVITPSPGFIPPMITVPYLSISNALSFFLSDLSCRCFPQSSISRLTSSLFPVFLPLSPGSLESPLPSGLCVSVLQRGRGRRGGGGRA